MRAYALWTVKSVSEDAREITGIATTPSPDRVGDVVDPRGATFALPIPLLWQHDPMSPIGHVTHARTTGEGIEIRAKLATIAEPGVLRDRLDEAWQSIKSGLVRGLSIGFRPLETARIETGVRFMRWEWLELSAVTVPANAECSIMAVKSAYLAASGARTVVRLNPKSSRRLGATQIQSSPPMSIAEKIAQFRAKLAAAQDAAAAIVTKSLDEGRTLDEHETEQRAGYMAEIKALTDHIKVLEEHEASQIAQATSIEPAAGAPAGTALPILSSPISVRRNLPKGTGFTRFAMALAASKGNLLQAEILANRWKDTPEVGQVLKAAVAEGTTSDATWAGPLVQYQDLVGEFIDLLRPATILGRMDQLRRVPFNVRIPRQTAGTTGGFVGEGAPAPVQKLDFDNITIPWAKASTIVVITAELAKLSNPSAEALVRQDLIDGISSFLDKRLLDPAYPGVANVSPASLTNGVTPRQASGATLAAIDDDVGYLMAQFANNELSLATGAWVMSAQLAITLSLMRTNQDTPAFPGLSLRGGTFYGLPVLVSNNVAPSGSPGDQHLILVDQREVLLADDGQMMLDVSTEASVQMDDAPSAGAQSLVSLWQNGLLGVKVDRFIYWAKRRSQAAQFIDAAQRYGS